VTTLLHWFNTEYWPVSWPNVFAPNVWTVLAVLGHLLATLAQRERQHREAERAAAERHEELKKHVTNTMGGAR
jgi:hypothetical protein